MLTMRTSISAESVTTLLVFSAVVLGASLASAEEQETQAVPPIPPAAQRNDGTAEAQPGAAPEQPASASPRTPDTPPPLEPAAAVGPETTAHQAPAREGPGPAAPAESLASIEEPNDDDRARPKSGPSRSRPRYHDGFYARLSAGAGYLSTSLEAPEGTYAISGAAAALDFMVGGTPVPGFAVGAAYLFTQAPSPEVSSGVGSATLDYAFNVGTLGVFADVFPDPGGGFHAGGVGGLAVASLSSESGELASAARGFGGGLLLGYDGWVGKQWAVGALARVLAASVSASSNGAEETLAPWSVAFVVSALNH
jgi:hypothetical protein